MTTRSLQLSDELHTYLVAHSSPLDQAAQDLMEETRTALPDDVKMQVAPEQAALLTMLTRLTGGHRVVEVGTFTGMSSLAIARGMPTGGRLTCFDVSAEFTAVAQRYWQRAGVADRIELRLGSAAERLRELPSESHLDFVFIDADKEGYLTYWSELVPRMRPGGLIAVDNVLWSGKVVDAASLDPDTAAIRRFNDGILTDDRVDLVMLPIADGLTLAYRR
jgi:caffeoyl-CoA O-methyltransferase